VIAKEVGQSMPQTVVLMRHARTSWNEQGRFNSTADLGIDAEGTRQAAGAATELARLEPFAFVRSDARRARETAACLEEHIERRAEIEPRLAEVDFGPFEGRTPGELAQDPAFIAWRSGDGAVEGGAEELEAAADRASTGLSEVLERHAGAPTIIVVSHGVLLRVLLCRVVLELPATAHRRLRLDNARAAVLTVGDGKPNLRLAAMNVSPADLAGLLVP
jgi:glucosyl-3-phosphoglycerate phosphatase